MDLAIMPITQEGYRCFLVYQDYYSKVIELLPLVEKTPRAVAITLVTQIFTRYGVCGDLYSDQGKEIDGRLIDDLCNLWGIRKTKTCSFPP